MPKKKDGMFDNLVSKTKIYLIIIAILFIIICVYNNKLILPGIIIYVLILAYTRWAENKRTTEISNHVQELLITMDSTAKKTLINSPLPLIIVETDGNIVWRSSKFVSEFANIDIKNYIEDLIKEIKLDIENNTDDKSRKIKKQIEIGNSTYKILGEYVKSKNSNKKQDNTYMAILYFIDVTEQIKISQKYTDESQCIGIITVDNYEEIMQRVSNEDKPGIIAELEKRLYAWAQDNKGLIIKTERNNFVYVFEHKYLKRMQKDRFDILDTIKEIDIEGRLNLTLSIAISDDGDTNYQKYESALAAMDIVLGRGGDQAVVKTNGKYKFYGGVTQEVEKRTKVKARVFAHALEELINNSKNVMVMGHENGDMDSMGSSLGIYRLAKSLGKEAYVINNTYGLSLSNFIENLKEDEEYKENVLDKNSALEKITSETLLVIVDTHKKSYVEVPELLEKTEKVVIIDHHRRSTDYIENALLTFQEVYASSAAELVTEILQYTEKDVKLKNIEVEALYAGIMMDTKNFTFKTGVRTFEAAAYLRKSGIDIIKVKKWFQSDLETYNLISKVVEDAEIIRNTIAISIYKGEKDTGIMCAKSADELLTISNITASFVLGKVNNKVCISGRSVGDINVQIILEKLGGGGHITLAGAQMEDKTIEDAKKQLIEKINEYFDENM